MKNKSIKSKIIAGLIMATMVITSSSLVFAAGQAKGDNQMKTQLDSLVTAGTITSDIETAVLNILTPSGNGGAGADGQGTAPSDQGAPGDGQGGFKTQLDALVTAGTITSDQETAVVAALTPSDMNGAKPSGDGQGTAPSDQGTPGDGQGGFQTQLDALVSAGTITSDQETAIITALTPSDKNGAKPSGDSQGTAPSDKGTPSDRFKTQLDALVTDGTMTADQETAIITALTPSNNGDQKGGPGAGGMGAPRDGKGGPGSQQGK